MTASEIIAVLEKRGMKQASADHPIYSAPPTIRFIRLSGSKTSTKRRKSAKSEPQAIAAGNEQKVLF